MMMMMMMKPMSLTHPEKILVFCEVSGIIFFCSIQKFYKFVQILKPFA